MPYLDTANQQIPYAPRSETSREGAQSAQHSAESKRAVMRQYYKHWRLTGLSDHDMHDLTGYDINVICARRNELGCVKVGARMGPRNVNVAIWILPEDAK